MNDWLNKPWAIRMISLILAVFIFIVISFDTQKNRAEDVGFDAIDSFFNSSQETRILENIPVNITIDDEKYVVSGVPQTVSVRLEGSVNVVRSTATQRNFDVFVDLENLEPGVHTVDLEHSGISDRMDVDIEPEEVEIIIEEKATKEFNVTVDYINEDLLEPEFELGEATVTPSTVTITSARSVVDQIAIVKAFIDVQKVDGPIDDKEVPVKVYDNQGNELNVRIEPVAVDVSLEVSSPRKEVPIHVETTDDLQDGLAINSIATQPGEVTVYGPEEVLATVDQIVTEDIDLSKLTEGATIEVGLVAPSGVRKLAPQQVTVEISMRTTEEQLMSNLPIEIENLGEGYRVTFVEPMTDEMNVTVSGSEEALNNLSEEEVRLLIDTQNLQEGEHEIPIEVQGPDNITIKPEIEHVTVRIE